MTTEDHDVPKSRAAARRKSMGDRQHANFVDVGESSDGSGHCIGITADGEAFSWSKRESGPTNEFGQLGRGKQKTTKSSSFQPLPVKVVIENETDNDDSKNHSWSSPIRFAKAYAGGTEESGHSALLTTDRTELYVCGCDRWQQLGLGSSHGGAVGYTWKGGRLWQTEFHRNEHVGFLIAQETDGNGGQKIRDVALGADHTVVLSSDQRTVYTFGRGGKGQLGVDGKPYVSAPTRAKQLSMRRRKNETDEVSLRGGIHAVCAVKDCTLTLGKDSQVMKKVGDCRILEIMNGLNLCQERARKDGLFS